MNRQRITLSLAGPVFFPGDPAKEAVPATKAPPPTPAAPPVVEAWDTGESSSGESDDAESVYDYPGWASAYGDDGLDGESSDEDCKQNNVSQLRNGITFNVK